MYKACYKATIIWRYERPDMFHPLGRAAGALGVAMAAKVAARWLDDDRNSTQRRSTTAGEALRLCTDYLCSHAAATAAAHILVLSRGCHGGGPHS